jgi:hypothetical protein
MMPSGMNIVWCVIWAFVGLVYMAIMVSIASTMWYDSKFNAIVRHAERLRLIRKLRKASNN